MNTMDDVKIFFNQGEIGTVETAASPGRALIKHYVPNIREVVILRPVDEVVDSVMKIDISDVAKYDRKILQKGMEYCERALHKIIVDPLVLVVNFSDLVREDICAQIFEYCLPYKFDRIWWENWKDKNVQIDTKELLRYRLRIVNVLMLLRVIVKKNYGSLFVLGKFL
jgi:hypothetical protein